jgi:hypothetical protein
VVTFVRDRRVLVKRDDLYRLSNTVGISAMNAVNRTNAHRLSWLVP